MCKAGLSITTRRVCRVPALCPPVVQYAPQVLSLWASGPATCPLHLLILASYRAVEDSVLLEMPWASMILSPGHIVSLPVDIKILLAQPKASFVLLRAVYSFCWVTRKHCRTYLLNHITSVENCTERAGPRQPNPKISMDLLESCPIEASTRTRTRSERLHLQFAAPSA